MKTNFINLVISIITLALPFFTFANSSTKELPIIVHGMVSTVYMEERENTLEQIYHFLMHLLDKDDNENSWKYIKFEITGLDNVQKLRVMSSGLGVIGISKSATCTKKTPSSIDINLTKNQSSNLLLCIPSGFETEVGQEFNGNILFHAEGFPLKSHPIKFKHLKQTTPIIFQALQWVFGLILPAFLTYFLWLVQQRYKHNVDKKYEWAKYQEGKKQAIKQYFSTNFKTIDKDKFSEELAKDLFDLGWRAYIPAKLNGQLSNAIAKDDQKAILLILGKCFPEFKYLLKP